MAWIKMNKCNRNKILAVLAALLIQLASTAQTYKSVSWSANVFIGVSELMGDLGGSDFIGSRGIFDMDIASMRPAIGAGFGFNISSISMSTNILFTHLAGNDELTSLDYQRERNLCVRTDLVEANLLAEFRPFSRSKTMSRFYIYSGIGGIYYQPKAEYNDDWYKLRTLGTEGQNLDGNSVYNELDIVIPYGLGYKFRLNRNTNLVLDLGFRKTFTDYLDDVSTIYVSTADLTTTENGAIAVALADRSVNGMAAGSPRGNPDKDDSYFLLGLKLELILGDRSGDGCYYNKNPKKRRSVKQIQRKMFKS